MPTYLLSLQQVTTWKDPESGACYYQHSLLPCHGERELARFLQSACVQRAACERPAKWLGKDLVEIDDEPLQLIFQVTHRGKVPPADYLPHDHAEDDLNL